MNNTLVLTGMMGSGKTSIGKEASTILGLKFYDTDLEIEKKLNMKIKDIFKLKGQNYFRQVEEKICIDLINGERKIVALGGGAFLNSAIREIVLKKSFSIWINVNLKTIVKRIKLSKNIRPMLDYDNLENSIKTILDERTPIYKMASITIEANNVSKKKIISEIQKNYGQSKKN
jgi:shikimate kinase|tara:strand:+ start:34 stop:555 length:522 start_codon:yes stop_codon:yes gene_type:complete